ncbi:hypothetical protein Q9L58_010471 [Maublancomyces gigas]|uniref:Uncharacterized protein n=1 Tax=Discina gigas TaxID=1032678 RepID=A0ABR3G411_9PEZI
MSDPVIHDGGTSLSQETLHEIKARMAAKTFDVTDYPALSLMKSGQPHYRQLVDEDGNIIGKWFKFMYLDFEDIQHLSDETIVELLEN